MTIVLCGSGSGGHITPLLAVAKEIKRLDDSIKLIYLGEKGGKFNEIVDNSDIFDEKHYISSGKFRRYHNESLVKRLLDVKTVFLNIRDLIKISIGILQGVMLLRKLKPHRVFLKGGSVCIPAGIGSYFAGIPTITHDSDALPGMSNRIGGKHALFHTTGMPKEYYKYPQGKIIQVGLPISDEFRVYSASEVISIKESLNIPSHAKVLLITGGSSGAKRLNDWCLEALPDLLGEIKDLWVIIVSGKNNKLDLDLSPEYRKRTKIIDFTSEMFKLSAVSDLIITRAGATTIAEFAAQSKALVLVPNPDLTGGHQLKNAKVYADSNAAVILDECQISENPSIIASTVNKLLKNNELRQELGFNLSKTLPKVPASAQIAKLLIQGRG
jgi:UDP-N-acetylglucosamine--N-acetylmuramyl-(pentapeptide) pyrophosphoryl-undecaprenol N-acetylglucosamine transferase